MAAPLSNCICGHRIEAPIATGLGDIYVQGDNPTHIKSVNSERVPPAPQHANMFCALCSSRILAANISRYKAAIETRHVERADFERRLLATRLANKNADEVLSLSTTRPIPDPSHIHQQVYELRQRLDKLRSISNELAIRVTSKTMENDERQGRFEVNYAKIDLGRERLDSMRQNLLVSSLEEKKGVDSTNNQVANVGGGLRDALVSGTRKIQTIRFHFALRVFEMHRIDVGEEYSNLMSGRNNAKSPAAGIGKIGGLPLPNAGPALYGVLPPGMLASSLRLVASLTNLLASCLGVVLPHPILVSSKECVRCGRVYNYGGDVIDTVTKSEADDESDNQCNLCTSCERDDLKEASEYQELLDEQSFGSKSKSPSSTLLEKIPSKSSLLSFVGTSARKAVALATGATPSSANSAAIKPPVKSSGPSSSTARPNQNQSLNPRTAPPSVLARRINHASFAVLLENHESGAAEYILNPPRWKEEKNQSSIDHQHQMFSNREEFHVAEEKFSTGLQLLQNDVIALCFRAGVDASTLWPAESVLLNLYSLLCHCVHVVEVNE